MNEGFVIKPLICDYCGSQLPVMDELAIFRCPVCYQQWLLSGEELKPIRTCRVPEDTGNKNSLLYLPFWVIEIDRDDLAKKIKECTSANQQIKRTIASTELSGDGLDTDGITGLPGQTSPAAERVKFISNAAGAVRTPHPHQIRKIINNIASRESFNIYVPAFHSRNTYTYIKVGRLMTSRQPYYQVTGAFPPTSRTLCVLQPEESIPLLDFIFISTLPEEVQACGDFISGIKVKPTSPPRLVEFPYLEKGAYLKSIIGNFQISNRLVENRPATAGSGPGL